LLTWPITSLTSPLPAALPALLLLPADMYHLDMSLWAFEKLADTGKGVVGIEFRDVACNYKPSKPARNPWGQRSGPDRGPPGNWNPAMDKRPNIWAGRRLKN
jgi:hypothetical protein